MTFQKALCFDDVLLVPRHWSGGSRKEVDISTRIAGVPLELPIISANMPSVSGLDMAVALDNAGGMSIFDRLCPIEEQVQKALEFRKISPTGLVGGSIGIGQDALEDAKKLIGANVDLICIDVAHGDQRDCEYTLEKFQEEFPKFPVIVGNFAVIPRWARTQSLNSKIAWKLGVGSGASCTTRIQTGCGLPTFQSILEFKKGHNAKDWLPAGDIIADGGIKNAGDCVKSLAAGADAVMLGSLLAGTTEAPGSIIKDDKTGLKYKVYRGNASAGSKIQAGLLQEFVEGAEMLVKFKGSVDDVLAQLEDGIRSGFTYCGARTLPDLQGLAKFMEISSAGQKENLPHGIFG